MAKQKSKSRTRSPAPETPPSAPKAKPRGTQNPANLKAILESRAAKPKLADLRAKKESAVQLRAKLEAHDLKVVAKSSAKHAKTLQKQISKVEADYAGRAARGSATKAAKAEAQQATLKALAGGRDELRAHARTLGIAGRSKMSVHQLRSAVAKAAAKSGTRLGAAAMIAGPATAALLAWDATKWKASASGLTDREVNTSPTKAALAAGGVTAAVGIGLSAALGMAAKAGPKMIGRLVPYAGEALMAAGAVQGAKKHGAPSRIPCIPSMNATPRRPVRYGSSP
jgi:hypothetical protein